MCFFALVIAMILIIQLSYYGAALGAGPTEIEVSFEPNKEMDINIHAVNSESYNFPVITYTDGELSEYLTLLGPSEVVLGPRGTDDGVYTFNYKLHLPDKLDAPGKHEGIIYVSQKPPEGSFGGVAAIIRVASRVIVYIPYPGKFIEAKLNTMDKNLRTGQNLLFSIDVINRGSLKIDNVYGIIDIYDSSKKLISSLRTNSSSVEAGEEAILVSRWLADEKPGKYTAYAKVYFDGNMTDDINDMYFILGSPSIDILSIKANPIENNTVGKIIVEIKSKWNSPIEDVYATIDVIEKDGKIIKSAKSESATLTPWGVKSLPIFLETEGIGIGNYTGIVHVNFFDKNKTAETVISIVPAKSYNMSIIVFAIAGVLIIMLVAFVIVRKRKGGYRSDGYIKSFK